AHLEGVDVGSDPAELEAAHAREATGIEALEHGGVRTGDAEHASGGQDVSAAAISPLPGREILVALDREDGEGEIAGDFFKAGVDLHAFRGPKIGITAVVSHITAEADEEIVSLDALISFRREESDIMNADILNPQAARDGPIAVQLSAESNSRPQPLLNILVVNAIIKVAAGGETIRRVKQIWLTESDD